MIGGMSGIENDVIPYGQASGKRAHLVGLNLVGLKRRGFSREEIQQMRGAFEQLFLESGTFATRLENVAKTHSGTDAVAEIVSFLRSESSRAVCLPEQAA